MENLSWLLHYISIVDGKHIAKHGQTMVRFVFEVTTRASAYDKNVVLGYIYLEVPALWVEKTNKSSRKHMTHEVYG